MKRALVVMILLAMILPLGAQSLWRDRNIYSAAKHCGPRRDHD